MKKVIKDQATKNVIRGISTASGIMISRGGNSLIPSDKRNPVVHGIATGLLIAGAVFMPGKGTVKEAGQAILLGGAAQQFTEVVKEMASPMLGPADTTAKKALHAAIGTTQQGAGAYRALRSSYSPQVLTAFEDNTVKPNVGGFASI